MLEILTCGALVTVQDSGRFGYRHLGVGSAGVMDCVALQQANLLLANERNAAALEIVLGPLHVKFHAAAALVLLGVDFNAYSSLPGNADHSDYLTAGFVHHVSAGTIVRLDRPALPGQSTIMAVSGGIDVPIIMGSRSTDLGSAFGGHEGRTLRAGDHLPLGTTDTVLPALKQGVRVGTADGRLRVIAGPEFEHFSTQAQTDFLENEWRVSPHSNRMGLRLNGKKLTLQEPLNSASAGTLPGVIQVPADGQPIVLGKDAQTMGGYPRIASVIGADLWQLAYLPQGSSLSFSRVTQEQALEANRLVAQQLESLELTLRKLRDHDH